MRAEKRNLVTSIRTESGTHNHEGGEGMGGEKAHLPKTGGPRNCKGESITIDLSLSLWC